MLPSARQARQLVYKPYTDYEVVSALHRQHTGRQAITHLLYQSGFSLVAMLESVWPSLIHWTRLSRHVFLDNAVRLQLFALAYNLGNLLRRLVLPRRVRHWCLTTLRDKLIKIGATVVSHGRYVTFQLAEVALPRDLFRQILQRIRRLGPIPDTG